MIDKFCLTVVLLLGLSGCSNVAELSDDVLADGGSDNLVLDNAASHFDLQDARAEQNAAARRWRASGIDTYELRISYDISDSPTYVLTIVEGQSVTGIYEPGSDGEVYPMFGQNATPWSVESLLDRTEDFVGSAESAPPNDPSSCDGHYFWISYDDLGFPSRWDTGTPCEDGVAFKVKLVETDG